MKKTALLLRQARIVRRAAFFAFAAAAFAQQPVAADDALASRNGVEIDHVSCTGGPNEIGVVIENVAQSVGLMTADLYRNDEDGFLKRDGRVQQVRFAAKAPMTRFCMRAPEPGAYAIAVYHDKNANKTFDKKAFGLPDEPYGISNDPKIRFGPPPISDALFEVADGGAMVDIKLKNN